MLLHYHHHSGHGFGSFFGKLFSRLATKTAAKTVARAVKVGARKAVKAATSSTARDLARKAAKEIGKEAARAGTELTVNKVIKPLAEKAINSGFSPDLVHKASTAGEVGARSAIDSLTKTGTKRAIDFIGAPTTPQKRKKKKSLSYLIDQA